MGHTCKGKAHICSFAQILVYLMAAPMTCWRQPVEMALISHWKAQHSSIQWPAVTFKKPRLATVGGVGIYSGSRAS